MYFNQKSGQAGHPAQTSERTSDTNNGSRPAGKMDSFDRAAAYLALQPRTEQEIRNYLKKKEYSESEIDDAVKKLLEYGYLDDAAYARSYYRQAAAKGKGKKKIQQELSARGVSSAIMENAFCSLEEEEGPGLFDEKKRALEIGVKMTRQQLADRKALDEKFLARVGRRLAGQGYSADVIYFVLGKLRGIRK